MTIRTLLLGSTAVFMATAGARAADAIVAAEPEPMDYVRVCDAYREKGSSFFFNIPGTETCLKISGYVRSDWSFGDNPYDGVDIGWAGFARGTIRLDARNDTEYGTVRSFIELRNDADSDSSSSYINSAYIEVGGFRAGYSDSQYDTWLNSAGNIINDDVVDYTGDRTNQISYTYDAGNGFSAMISLEEGSGTYDTGYAPVPTASYNGGNAPFVLGGVKYEQEWGGIIAALGYDSDAEAFGGKVRVDVKVSDGFSVFVMGGYQSDWDNDNGPGGSRQRNYYGPWRGDWAAWGGFSADLSKKASLNGQLGYEEDGTLAAALNIDYAIVQGLREDDIPLLTVQPELNYTNFGGERGNGEAFGGIVRIQRNF